MPARGNNRNWLRLLAVALSLAPSVAAGQGATSIPVPSVTIMQGDLVSGELLVDQSVTASERVLRNYFTSREAVEGKVARRVLPAGHAIPINAVREPYLFKEGERVSIVFTAGGLSIEASGIALHPGVLGNMISVRNADTGIIVRGAVQADGRVQVGGN